MDTRTFYGRKVQDQAARAVPSDSEDSELDDSDNEDSELKRRECLSDDSDSESVDQDEDEVVVENPSLPRWRTPHNAFYAHPEWQGRNIFNDIMSPLEYFQHFFSEDILQDIVGQSNLYAIQCDPNKPLNLSTQELEQFLGTVVYMSLFGLPGTRMFWNKACRVSQVADTMTLNRWEAIKKALHFNNNEERQEENDPIYKLRPLVTHLNSKLTSIPMSENLVVDEQMVPFKGRSRIKQYLPSKPKKWGYKLLVLAGSDGVPHNFEIYTGRVVQPPELADIGASGNVVLRLAQPIPKHENYKLFFDNWFTSVPLVLTLAQQGIHSIGTVRCNRLPGVSLMSDAELKRTGRGSFQQKMAMVGETTLHVVKWYDNRSVTILSDYTGAHPVTEVQRWDRKKKMLLKVPRPAVVKIYNKNMGGVDLLDSLIALYRTKIRLKKWYRRLVFHFLDLIVKDQMKRGPAAPIPVPDVRLDATAHWMIMVEKKGRCKVPGCTGTPKAKCQKCGVHLCFTSSNNCFLRFHTE
uniref:PiggyBac transposable element-derived protein domain-containing protein n=1 Tax=Cyclopterus lumpus TaxID=8103 RepID=A0A8C3A2I5_CYCLU